jgi:hypothetical protein
MDNKRSHLEMIQGIVNRLSQNSFLLKGWSVILISALFALSAQNKNQAFVFLAYLPLFVFWFLDAYFLCQERLFRALYDKVRLMKESDIDFCMDTSAFNIKNCTYRRVFFSKTLVAFHGTLLAAILIVMLVKIS